VCDSGAFGLILRVEITRCHKNHKRSGERCCKSCPNCFPVPPGSTMSVMTRSMRPVAAFIDRDRFFAWSLGQQNFETSVPAKYRTLPSRTKGSSSTSRMTRRRGRSLTGRMLTGESLNASGGLESHTSLHFQLPVSALSKHMASLPL